MISFWMAATSDGIRYASTPSIKYTNQSILLFGCPTDETIQVYRRIMSKVVCTSQIYSCVHVPKLSHTEINHIKTDTNRSVCHCRTSLCSLTGTGGHNGVLGTEQTGRGHRLCGCCGARTLGTDTAGSPTYPCTHHPSPVPPVTGTSTLRGRNHLHSCKLEYFSTS